MSREAVDHSIQGCYKKLIMVYVCCFSLPGVVSSLDDSLVFRFELDPRDEMQRQGDKDECCTYTALKEHVCERCKLIPECPGRCAWCKPGKRLAGS